MGEAFETRTDPPRRGGTRSPDPRGSLRSRAPHPARRLGEEPPRNHRVGPWAPVIPVKVGPSNVGGDNNAPPATSRAAAHVRWLTMSFQDHRGGSAHVRPMGAS